MSATANYNKVYQRHRLRMRFQRPEILQSQLQIINGQVAERLPQISNMFTTKQLVICLAYHNNTQKDEDHSGVPFKTNSPISNKNIEEDVIITNF